MDPFVVGTIVVLALVAATFLGLALRFPVLFRMGVRNALRRKAQTAVVVAGLMVGTAIIAGSLASGDSLTFGIRKGAYDALGPADLFIQTDSQLHYPKALYDDLEANASVRASTAGLSPLLYEEAALNDPAKHLTEPRVSLIGFDPAANRAFGAFHTTDGRTLDGSDLGPNEIYVLDKVASKLDAQAGTKLRLNFEPAPTPRIPRFYQFNGSVAASAGACPNPLLCQYVAPPNDASTFQVPVLPGAVGMTTVVVWFGPNAQTLDLDQVLVAPDGTQTANSNGTLGQPDNPSVLNVTAEKALAPGNWTLQVRAKAAANQPFRAIALVFYEEYNLSAFQAFAQQAKDAGFDASALQGFGGGGATGQGQSVELTVKAVLTKEGMGGFLLGSNAFARADTVARLYGVEGKINLIAVSGDHDPTRGADHIPALLLSLPKAVNASAALHPDMPAIKSVKVFGVKNRFLQAAERAGTLFKQFLTTIGSFTVIAGIMLIVNIFVMLAEERKSELGMARAVGLSRWQLVHLFNFEGALYALVASAIGVGLGVLLAFGLITGFNDILASSQRSRVIAIPFHVAGDSLLYAFAAGFLITLVTIAIASARVSRLNIVRAIRRQEDPARRATRTTLFLGLALLVGGLAYSAFGFATGDFVARIMGPCIALFGVGLVGARFVPRQVAYPVTGLALAGYCLYTIFTFGNPDGLLNAIMGPVRGLFIVLAAVLILIYLPQVVRVTRAVLLRFARLVPAVRPGVAYPLEKKTRTGLTVTMFSLVILVVVVFSVFGATFAIDLKAQSGGYDVEGDTAVPVGDLKAYFDANHASDVKDPFPRIQRYDQLRYAIAFGGTLVKINGEKPQYQGPQVDYVYSYDEAFARNNQYDFVSLDPKYPTAQSAYEAVLKDPTLVIVSEQYDFDDQGKPGAHHVGDILTMETTGGTASFRIIGFQKQLFLGGIFVNPQVLDNNFQRIRGEYLIKLKPGEDATVAAREIEAGFEKAGMDAQSIEEQAQQQLEQSKRFLTLFQLFLGFGLVVGIASLGIVTARSVLERRQEIGMLRAVGYQRSDVLRMFYIEIFLTTTLGILIGAVIGLFTSYGVVVSTPALAALGVKFTIPWLDLGKILLLVYVAVFLATYLPARRGSLTPPAEAVRYIE